MTSASWLDAQIGLAGAACAAGLLLGFFYTIYAALTERYRFRAARSLQLPDFLFALCSIAGLIVFWFLVTDGSLRLSSFILLWASFFFFRQVIAPRISLVFVRSQAREKKRRARQTRKQRQPGWPVRAATKAAGRTLFFVDQLDNQWKKKRAKAEAEDTEGEE